MNGKIVKLKKIDPFDTAYHAAIAETLEDWASPEDEEAFDDLSRLGETDSFQVTKHLRSF
ncbi:hypothetical protein ACFL2E_09575 [Thermodesulfobacteriota bacterium]